MSIKSDIAKIMNAGDQAVVRFAPETQRRMPMFSGYKTYFVGGLAVLGFVVGFLDGDLTLAAAINGIVPAVLAMTLRSGIANSTF